MKRAFRVSAIAAALLFSSVSLQANSQPLLLHRHKIAHAPNKSASKEIAFQKKGFKAASKEIMSGLQKTLEAIDALEANKIDKAKKALEHATKSFDTALKTDPKLKLVPFEQVIEYYTLETPPNAIEKATHDAIALLKKHQLQAARALLTPMKDELDIDTVSIPMDLYPVAAHNALDALKKGDKDAALIALAEGMSTLVDTRVVIPMGLLVAQDFVKSAAALDKKKKKEALKLLDAAHNELEKARLLGYVSTHAKEYRSLQKQIAALEKEIRGKNEVEKLYDRLKSAFSSLLNKTRKEGGTVGTAAQKKAEEKVIQFEKREEVQALKERQKFLKNALQDATKASLNQH